MRPKVILAIFLTAALTLGVVFYLNQHWGNAGATNAAKTPAAPGPATTAPMAATNAVVSVAPPPEPLPIPAGPMVTSNLTDEQRQANIDAEIDRLQQWSMNDDPASLSNILADLTSSDKEIRDAAIEATKEFGSTNAIPALKAAAESTDDLQQKIAYLEAADFLSLPSMDFNEPAPARTTEQIQAKAERDARRQAQMQSPKKNQDSQPPPDQNSQTGPNQ